MSKVMTIGEILVEIMATRRGQSLREPGLLKGPYASGAPAIFIDQVARLGQAAGIIGCVGDDEFGHLNVERLQRDGVDTRSIHVIPQASTGSAFVTYREDGERDFVFNIVHSASSHLTAALVDAQVLEDCQHFHVMGSSLFSAGLIEATRKAIEIVKAQGGSISFDPNVRKEMLNIPEMRDAFHHVLGLTDLFMPSGQEATFLAGTADEASAVTALQAMGVKEVVIKRGALGSTYFGEGVRLDVPALEVPEVDPTGAGDCFGATFITCRLRGMAPRRALRYANAAGALAVGQWGPMEGTADFAALDALLARSAGD